MEIQFKTTDGPLIDYPYLPVSGELLLKIKDKYAAIWSRDETNTLVPLAQGWNTHYQDLYYIVELPDLEDVTIASPNNYQIVKYSSGEWTNAPVIFTNLNTNFYDINFTRYEVTSSSINITTAPIKNATIKARDTTQTVSYLTRSTSTTPSSGSWSLFLAGVSIYLRLHRYDAFNVLQTSKLRSMVSNNKTEFTLNIGNSRYNVKTDVIWDYLDSSGYLQMQLQPSLVSSNYAFYNTVPYDTLIFSNYQQFDLDEKGPIMALPDGGNFNSIQLSSIAYMPDGGTLKDKSGYLYLVNLGTSNAVPDSAGEFGSTSTTYLRIYTLSTEKESLNINDYGGIGGVIPAPGMKITVYGNAYAGDHYLTSYSGTATWISQGGYYQIRVNQNLTTLFTGASGIQIHRPNGPFYEWVT